MKFKLFPSVWVLMLCLCLAVIGYFSFTVQATDAEITNSVEPMAPKDCHVQWTIGTTSTGWIDLGEVSGFLANKKAEV